MEWWSEWPSFTLWRVELQERIKIKKHLDDLRYQ